MDKDNKNIEEIEVDSANCIESENTYGSAAGTDDISSSKNTYGSKKKVRNWSLVYTIFAIVALITFIGGFIFLGKLPDWAVFLIACSGSILLMLIVTVKRIITVIKLLMKPKQTLEMIKDVASPFIEIGKEYKSNYKSAERKHKQQIWIIIGTFAFIMLCMFIGVLLLKLEVFPVLGFILMGISGGGMFVWLLTLFIISKKSSKKSSKK